MNFRAIEKIVCRFVAIPIKILFCGSFTVVQLRAAPISTCPPEQIISEIHFEGLNTTAPLVVQREILHKKGTVFSCALWKKERKNLEGLDIFASVDLHSEVEGDSVFLTYEFGELPWIIPIVGIKKTDQEGVFAGPALSILNLAGRDIRLEAHAKFSLSEWRTSRDLLFYAGSPWLGSLPIEYEIVYNHQQNFNDYGRFPEFSHSGEMEFKWRFFQNLEWIFFGGLFYINIEDSSASRVLLTESGNSDLVPRLGSGLQFDNRESKINPHRGMRFELYVKQSGGFLGGDANSQEWISDWRGFFPLSQKQVLHVSALSRLNTGEVGVYRKYFAGGANTLRGYDPGSLRGFQEAIATAEYRYEWFSRKTFSLFGIRLFWGLQTVAGVDAALLAEEWGFKDGKFGSSFYGGLHILVPALDRIRLEFGKKMVRAGFGFDVGLFEKTEVQRWRIR